MPSHSLPSCIGSVESCAPSPPVTISIAPFCESIFTPATRKPAATTALTARVTSRCRKADGRRVIVVIENRPGCRRAAQTRGRGRWCVAGGPPARTAGGRGQRAGGRVVRDSRPGGRLEGPAPRPPLQGAHFFARCSPLKDEHLAGGMSTLQELAWPRSTAPRHLGRGIRALQRRRVGP